MSKMKQFISSVSVDMGYEGDFTPEVLAEADRRLKAMGKAIQEEFHVSQDNERLTHRVSQRFGEIICEISEED